VAGRTHEVDQLGVNLEEVALGTVQAAGEVLAVLRRSERLGGDLRDELSEVLRRERREFRLGVLEPLALDARRKRRVVTLEVDDLEARAVAACPHDRSDRSSGARLWRPFAARIAQSVALWPLWPLGRAPPRR
jgi:hypothetical protein